MKTLSGRLASKKDKSLRNIPDKRRVHITVILDFLTVSKSSKLVAISITFAIKRKKKGINRMSSFI
jgi:hypothetical protein